MTRYRFLASTIYLSLTGGKYSGAPLVNSCEGVSDVPAKADIRKAHLRNDPMVPVVGHRVQAALKWRKKSHNQAAAAAGVSRQAVADITRGKTRKCRRSIRAAIAKLCGPPITVKYLAGKEALRIPPLSVMPSGSWPQAIMPADSAGVSRDLAARELEQAPQYEMEGFGLGQLLASAPDLDNALGSEHPRPDVEHASRWLVSLYLWREHLFGGQKGALGGHSYRTDASEFAHHLAQAITVLLRPWLDGRVSMRPGMMRRWVRQLDAIAAEVAIVALARQHGDLSELAIWDIAGGQPDLRAHLTAERDRWRDKGVSEAVMAKRIRRWSY